METAALAKNLPKLLVVDDDKTVMAAISRLLRGHFHVIEAKSGEEAVVQLNSHPDLAIVLTDYVMPGISGLDLLAKAQELVPDAARVLLSGRIDAGAMVEAINASKIHRLFLKPWDNEYLRLQMFEALAIHQTLKERRELEKLSFTDALTHIKNRRYFQDRLKAEVERSVRHSRPLALIMVDIDHFKKLNDHFGHLTGDRVLRDVATKLNEQIRSIDTIARYGGEEFAVLLPDTTRAGAMVVAERMRISLEKCEFECDDRRSLKVTISLGVAEVPLDANTAFGLIEKADAALYQAKRQGRNQTVGA